MRKSRSNDRKNSVPHFFKYRTFKELIRASQLIPVLELATLKAKIPEEASTLIIGITDPAEA